MTLRDLLKKKNDIEKNGTSTQVKSSGEKTTPYQTEFTFLRTTTADQEVIQPPTFPGDQEKAVRKSAVPSSPDVGRKRRSFFSRDRDSQHEPTNDNHDQAPSTPPQSRPKTERKLSDRLLSDRLSTFRISSRSSWHERSTRLPADLDQAPQPVPAPASPEALKKRRASASNPTTLAQEAEWEARATQLALSSAVLPAASRTPSPNPEAATSSALRGVASAVGSVAGSSSPGRATSQRTVDEQALDETELHAAISLHERGQLGESTVLFARLASPSGANSALAQVLYGLALRHGWGCDPSPADAVHFLSLAAKNSAGIEAQALRAGMARGGSAKGELVLAIFELANCYRYGWGVDRDPKAAREFYETAANLGDVDAMEEAAWCFLEGFGGPKDKGKAALYLRRAEEGGRKRVGDSWIWKDKYNPQVK